MNTEPQWRCGERHRLAMTLLLIRCGVQDAALGSWMHDTSYGYSETQKLAAESVRDISSVQGVCAHDVEMLSRRQSRHMCRANGLSAHVQAGPSPEMASFSSMGGTAGRRRCGASSVTLIRELKSSEGTLAWPPVHRRGEGTACRAVPSSVQRARPPRLRPFSDLETRPRAGGCSRKTWMNNAIYGCILVGSHGVEPLSTMTGVTLVGVDRLRARLSSSSRRNDRPLRRRGRMNS